ncbi:PREDICTED: serine/threonine kinase-like domain-containing protein STKLD1 [Amphimedon queenslandica]|uniref:Protein kinase domain-containing protein n=1 Tax=Amphimedon queenslandica TaxID=400682 RepID=A0AAN0IYF4_AMPQE|nr:PREDICTED: serine/threonine kinase-like domain-containing protein STKLD1 [Amphimedon queenslandica]|eukprot:XP_019849795.1 PREDICTED: serine/threonine kinase-like domain-containing protein STKLD1 [Amphimedon queenslandica]
MEYKYLDQLTDTTWLVQELASDSQYVTKKIECIDEMEANVYFNKMISYQKLKHSFLVPSKHIYIKWDEEDSAVYLCIISKYMPKGSLGQLLMSKRKDIQWLEKTLLLKWTGQLIEVLVYMHRQNYQHKRLNTNNVFLSENDTMCVGDSPPALRSSIKPGSLKWLAPELVDDDASPYGFSYDERSDIWSLGCIILEMATTGCLTDTGFLSLIYQLRINTEVLSKILKEVEAQYGSEISDLIQSMLRLNYHQRPLAIDLCYKPIIKDSLALYDSGLLKELDIITDDQDIIATKLSRNKFSVVEQCEVLKHLIQLLQGNDSISLKPVLQELIIGLSIAKTSSSNLICESLRVLHYGSDIDLLLSSDRYTDVFSLCIAAIELHSSDIKTVNSGLSLLNDITIKGHAGANNKLLSTGILLALMDTSKRHKESSCTLELVFKVLLNLVKPMSVLNASVSGEMVELTLSSLSSHIESSSLVLSGLSLLWESCRSVDVLTRITSTANNINLLSRILHEHIQNTDIILLVIKMTILICSEKDDLFFALVDLKVTPNGVAIIIGVIKHHALHEEIMEQTLALINIMTKHVEIKQELIQNGLMEILSNCTSSNWRKELRDSVHGLLSNLAEHEA